MSVYDEWMSVCGEWMSVYDEWMSVYDEWMSVYDEWLSVYDERIHWMFSVFGECRVHVGVVDCKRHHVCHVIYVNYNVWRYTTCVQVLSKINCHDTSFIIIRIETNQLCHSCDLLGQRIVETSLLISMHWCYA